MLAPGSTLSAAGRLFATIGIGVVPDFVNQGVGYKANGSVCLDTAAPSAGLFANGYTSNVAGSLYATTAQNASDVYVNGLRTSALGQICIESADAVTFSNGNGITAAGNLSVN